MTACFECGAPAKHNHHVVPQSFGGTKTVPLCEYCHPKAHGEKGYWNVSDLAKQRVLRMRANRQWTGGKVPYGYQLTKDRRLTFVSHEWQILKTVFVKRLLGFSFLKIATQLNEMGTLTKNGAPKWTKGVVKQIIRRRSKQPWRHKKTRAPF